MRTIRPNKTRIRASAAAFFAVVALMIVVAGCNKNYGRFTIDTQVSQAFRTGAMQPEFNYYYTGRDTMPYAIIGIDHGYTVPSRYWIPFEPEPAQLKKMSQNIYRYYHFQPYGSTILDSEGKVVGVWYSNIFQRSVTVDQENHTVQVLYENPENFDGGSGGGTR